VLIAVFPLINRLVKLATVLPSTASPVIVKA
jgi:hypothetical protein